MIMINDRIIFYPYSFSSHGVVEGPEEEEEATTAHSSSDSSHSSAESSAEGEEEEQGDEEGFGFHQTSDEIDAADLSDPPSESEASEDLEFHPDPFYASPEVEGDEADPYRQSFEKQKAQSRLNIGEIMKDGEMWVMRMTA